MFSDKMKAQMTPLFTAIRTHGTLELWFLAALKLEMFVNTALVSVGPAALSADIHVQPTRPLLSHELLLHCMVQDNNKDQQSHVTNLQTSPTVSTTSKSRSIQVQW